MKWSNYGVKQYIAAKEYIDTAVIPLVPIGIDQEENLEKSTLQHETMQFFSSELEKELTGRLIMTPIYTYLMKKDLNMEAERLETWLESLESTGFKHIFLLTFDPLWRKQDKHLPAELIWMPCADGREMSASEFRQSIRSQVRDVMDLMMAAWEE